MDKAKSVVINSPIGKQEIDSGGSPIGVARLDVGKSYANIGELLQKYINDSDQDAWAEIKAKIDYTYESLDFALSSLEKETTFSQEINSRLEKGQKLLFKPNLVNPSNIDPQTHGPDLGYTACTEWGFIAALMRWFHDKIGVSYHQMTIGEAATAMTAMAGQYSVINPEGKTITPEAVIEGKSGNFYGGWGFYFTRQYLSETLGPNANDNPMNGYQESETGTYIPPGLVSDKLMVYDLNRIYDDPNKGKSCEIPDGVNYKSITLHKAIVGGNPDDSDDLKAYPGCVLINVPKFKVHAITLFTNIIKNLGIGLYPMQYASGGDYKWDYSLPHDTPVTGIKGGIPHQVWVPEMDFNTGIPKRDSSGAYIVNKTGGITATMIDIIKATSNQDIFMMHIVDGIEAINIDHQGMGSGVKESEGIVFIGLDPVATDLLSARYMFSNVSLKQALEVNVDDGTGGSFPQEVPIPTVEGDNIISNKGYDCPLSRDICFEKADERGLGQRQYYVVGHDQVTDSPVVSIQGHLGTVSNNTFSDLITDRLYFDMFSVPWDLQKTTLNYMDAVDKLEGTTIKDDFLKSFDEDGDGIVTYEEYGKKGVFGVFLHVAGDMISELGSEELGYLKGHFKALSRMYKNSDKQFNTEGHDVMKEFYLATACSAALQISQLEMEVPDPFVPGLTCGKGNWPSFQLANFFQTGVMLFGAGFPYSIASPSLYASLLFYADLIQNGGQYAGKIRSQPDPEAINRYMADVSSDKIKPLDFTFYVPAGFDNLSGTPIPNVKVTEDPAKIFTASLEGGKEIWP